MVVSTLVDERMMGGGKTRKGIFVVVVWSVVVKMRVVVSVHFFVCTDTTVTFVVVAQTRDEQAEEIVWDEQVVRAVGVTGCFAAVAEVAERLSIAEAGPLL